MVGQSKSTFKTAIQKSTAPDAASRDVTKPEHERVKIPVPIVRWFGYGFVLFSLFCFEIYFGIVTLSAHQLHHRVRDIDINGDKTVIVSQLAEFDDKFSNVESEYQHAIQDTETLLTSLAEQKTELLELRRTKNKYDSETLTFISQLELLKSYETSGDEEAETLKGKIRSVEDIIGAGKREADNLNRLIIFEDNNHFQTKCEIVRDVISADNIRVIKTSRLLTDYGFGVTKPSNSTLDDALALGEYFNMHQDIALKKDENDNPLCPLPIIQRGKNDLTISRHILDARADIQYFTSKKQRHDTLGRNGLSDSQANAINMPASKTSLGNPSIFNLPALISLPQQMLTIIVVLIMGALGATISVTRTYLDRDFKPWLPAYIFMPLLGAVTGFVVFVLAKAGVLIIADGGSNGSGAYLSPYFISFIGLVSGMLVIDALDTITKIGRTWFSSSSEGVKRWAVGLEAEANDEALIDKISEKLGEKTYKIKAWLEADEDVPPRTQSDLAFILDKDIRQIFTDIPPKKTPAPTEDA